MYKPDCGPRELFFFISCGTSSIFFFSMTSSAIYEAFLKFFNTLHLPYCWWRYRQIFYTLNIELKMIKTPSSNRNERLSDKCGCYVWGRHKSFTLLHGSWRKLPINFKDSVLNALYSIMIWTFLVRTWQLLRALKFNVLNS